MVRRLRNPATPPISAMILAAAGMGLATADMALATADMALAALTPATAERASHQPAASGAARPDSQLTVLPGLVVNAGALSRTAPAEIRVGDILVERQDPGAVADLGPLLPATRVLTNSRGESLFMVRGAPERHVRLWLDGLPLAVPWDERVDLAMVPALGVNGVAAVRGATGALAGVGALAASIDLTTAAATDRTPAGWSSGWSSAGSSAGSSARPSGWPVAGQSTRVQSAGGEVGAFRIAAEHRRRGGDWHVVAAAGHRTRDGVTVPAGLDAPHHQSGSVRTNSDLRQSSLLLAARRPVAGDGQLRLNLLASDGSKGVPPETHVADSRFWRYPLQRRLLAGGTLETPLDAERRWRLATTLAVDLFRQDIRPYDDARYAGPPLQPGTDFEQDRDLTGYLRTRLDRDLDAAAALSLQLETRYARHRETLVVGGDELAYAQWLGGLTAEARLGRRAADRWRLTVGGGWELAATPESGDRPDRGTTGAGVMTARLERDLGAATTIYAAAARRSRFPSLRELYSGALGRFLPNPDLAPERQDLLEGGFTVAGRGDRAAWDAGVSAFATWLHDGIERVMLPGPSIRYQRVNRTRVRTLGAELVASWRPRTWLSLSAHHAVLTARVLQDGSYDLPAEDRPQFITMGGARWLPSPDWEIALQAHVLGPRHSADATAPDGLRRLPAQARWDVRLAWTTGAPLPGVTAVELVAGVDNLSDAVIETQTGLPEPGRTFHGGLNLRLGEG
ncbi:MAG: TonB-dependent receptor [Candidatus Krumholzibacteriia bacterium]